MNFMNKPEHNINWDSWAGQCSRPHPRAGKPPLSAPSLLQPCRADCQPDSSPVRIPNETMFAETINWPGMGTQRSARWYHRAAPRWLLWHLPKCLPGRQVRLGFEPRSPFCSKGIFQPQVNERNILGLNGLNKLGTARKPSPPKTFGEKETCFDKLIASCGCTELPTGDSPVLIPAPLKTGMQPCAWAPVASHCGFVWKISWLFVINTLWYIAILFHVVSPPWQCCEAKGRSPQGHPSRFLHWLRSSQSANLSHAHSERINQGQKLGHQTWQVFRCPGWHVDSFFRSIGSARLRELLPPIDLVCTILETHIWQWHQSWPQKNWERYSTSSLAQKLWICLHSGTEESSMQAIVNYPYNLWQGPEGKANCTKGSQNHRCVKQRPFRWQFWSICWLLWWNLSARCLWGLN